MELYLIRHGETVDNVAGLYAGVRDSALTVHGVEQARRLGCHLAKSGALITHMFSSPLSRALKTAQSIRIAQEAPRNDCDGEVTTAAVEIVEIADLIEQDFGYYEGKPFYARSKSTRSGKDVHRNQHKNERGFVDVESKESMAKRADAFLDNHLLPIFDRQPSSGRHTVVVVSHGILLSQLWRRLLKRLPQRGISSQEVLSNGLEHLGGWSNTGYLHLSLSQAEQMIDGADNTKPRPAKANEQTSPSPKSSVAKPVLEPHPLEGWLLNIVSVDTKLHLVGLKRQRGGIGRLAYDEGQTKLDGFFKRQKTC